MGKNDFFYNNFVFAVDITVYHGGFHGDLNETFFVGNVDDDSRKLVQTAYECMMKGIEIGEYQYNIFIKMFEFCPIKIFIYVCLQFVLVRSIVILATRSRSMLRPMDSLSSGLTADMESTSKDYDG